MLNRDTSSQFSNSLGLDFRFHDFTWVGIFLELTNFQFRSSGLKLFFLKNIISIWAKYWDFCLQNLRLVWLAMGQIFGSGLTRPISNAKSCWCSLTHMHWKVAKNGLEWPDKRPQGITTYVCYVKELEKRPFNTTLSMRF